MEKCTEAVTELSSFLNRTHQQKAQKKQGAAEAQTPAALLFGSATDDSAPQPISVDITFVRAPQPHRAPLFFTLPNAFHDTANVCVVVPPPQRKYKDLLQSANPALPNVKKVVDVNKLGAKFSEPVARRALAKSFDVFFVHHDIKQFPKLLTGEFLEHQTPVWMAKGDDFADSIRKTFGTVVVPRRGFCSVSIKVGHAGLSPKALEQNVLDLMEQMKPWLTGGLEDVHSISVSGPTATGRKASLPFYARNYIRQLPDASAAGEKKDAEEEEEDPSAKKQRV